MPLEQVADLLAQWRAASGVFSRSRVLTQAIQSLSNLTPDERRSLARALAEQGSPDLARQVEDRTGGTVRANRFSTVADGLLALEDDELDRLVTGLRDPETRERLARETLEQAAQGPPAPPPGPGGPTGSDDARSRPAGTVDLGALPPPGAGPDWRPEADEDLDPDARLAEVRAETRRLHALSDSDAGLSEVSLDTDGVELGSADLVSPELGGQDLDEPSLGEISLVPSTVHEIELDGVDLVGPEQPVVADLSDDAGPSAAPVAAEVVAERPGASTDPDDPSGADDADDADDGSDGSETEPTGAAGGGDGAPNQPATGVGPHPQPDRPARDRLRDATTATERLAIVGAAGAAGIGGPDALDLLDALPDGWQRRRAAERLAEAGRLPTDDLPALFRRFARGTDATFVAGTLLATDAVTADDLEGALPDRTVRRLRARAER